MANDKSSEVDGANISAEPFKLREAKVSNTVIYTCPFAFGLLRTDLLAIKLRMIGNLRRWSWLPTIAMTTSSIFLPRQVPPFR